MAWAVGSPTLEALAAQAVRDSWAPDVVAEQLAPVATVVVVVVGLVVVVADVVVVVVPVPPTL